jgi:hypothetical protein
MITLAPAPVDLLAEAVEAVRPLLRAGSTKERVRILWSAARSARGLATEDQIERAFLQLAIEVGLIDQSGYWTGEDVRPDLRRHGRADVLHVLRWAALNRNPFEKARR